MFEVLLFYQNLAPTELAFYAIQNNVCNVETNLAGMNPRSEDLQSEAMLIRGFLIHTLLPRDYIV